VLNIRKRMDEVLAHHTGKTVEQIHLDTERDYFLGAEEARDYGIIDKVVEER
jgi:ATP-dependent Clp protease, protease subunit